MADSEIPRERRRMGRKGGCHALNANRSALERLAPHVGSGFSSSTAAAGLEWGPKGGETEGQLCPGRCGVRVLVVAARREPLLDAVLAKPQLIVQFKLTTTIDTKVIPAPSQSACVCYTFYQRRPFLPPSTSLPSSSHPSHNFLLFQLTCY